jgi:hypothetical protein
MHCPFDLLRSLPGRQPQDLAGGKVELTRGVLREHPDPAQGLSRPSDLETLTVAALQDVYGGGTRTADV